jgi:molecular chaperone GrpE
MQRRDETRTDEGTGDGDAIRPEAASGAEGGAPSGEAQPNVPAAPRDGSEVPGPGGIEHDPALDEVPQRDGHLAAELEELKDRHLRLAAEFENFRKRSREEFSAASARAKAALIGSLLDVLDDFHRMHAVETGTATAASVLEGVALVQRKLDRVLEEAGLEMIHPAGQPFDPETMEAVMRVPVDDPERDDHVAEVFQAGARFRGQLVRPARVSVLKAD